MAGKQVNEIGDRAGTVSEDIVYLDLLKDCPVRITLHPESMIERICRVASSHYSQVPRIDVARIENAKASGLVVVDGHARVFALRRIGANSVRARVHMVKSMADAVALHVRMNSRGTVNPLKYSDLYEFLCRCGLNQKEIVNRLWLGEIQTRLLRVRISAVAKDMLEEYLVKLASKYSFVHLPPYVIEALGRIRDEKTQEKAVKMMIQMIPENVPEMKFSFPSFDQLEIAFSTLHKGQTKLADPVVFSPADERNDSEKVSKDVEYARELIGQIPHRALLKCPHGGKFLVDLKDHTISEIKEDDRVVSIEGDSSEPLLMVPPKYAKSLGLDSGDRVYFEYVLTSNQLLKFVEKIKGKRHKLLIMSGTEI